jgi:hypothetical protein
MMRFREWYFRIFCYLVDTTVISAWMLYQQVYVNKGTRTLNQEAFRVDLVESLCTSGPQCAQRGRLQSSDLVEEAKKTFRDSFLPTRN